ncbi:MAG TPA: carbohydrate ABC transporter permease [Planctomycetota bacterium]|nr:carbohydrate ABC transporter permease [Planctomycetota bacterium]
MAFPFLWMVMTALKSETEARGTPTLLPSGWPTEWHWGNFARAWQEMEPSFATCFLNTFIVATLVTVGVVVTSLLAGYAFARIPFRGRRALFVVFLATMMVPFEVVLVPNFMLVTAMKNALREGLVGLLGQGAENAARTLGAFGALVVPWCANVFSIFLVTQFFRQLPQDYYDAAVLDGCGHWQFVWRIGMPMVAPALVTAGLFTFLGSWNSLLWPLVVNTPDEAPVIQVALSYMVREEREGFNLLMAASTFTILPVVFLYLIAQRRFIEGVTGTGLKG